jgi:hypothetical protein
MKHTFALLTALLLASLAKLGAMDGEALKKTQLTGPSLEDAVLYVPQNVDSAINLGGRDFSRDFQEATGKTLQTTPVLSGKHL